MIENPNASEQLDRLVIHATPGDLIRALAMRGAKFRRLNGERVKVSLTLRTQAPRAGCPPKRHRAPYVNYDDPMLRI